MACESVWLPSEVSVLAQGTAGPSSDSWVSQRLRAGGEQGPQAAGSSVSLAYIHVYAYKHMYSTSVYTHAHTYAHIYVCDTNACTCARTDEFRHLCKHMPITILMKSNTPSIVRCSVILWTWGRGKILLIKFRYNAFLGFPGGSDSKESACSAEDLGSIPSLGRSPGEGHGNLLQYYCLEISMDRGAWWSTVYGVARSDMPEQLTHHTQTQCFLIT